jgi:outer membrane protein TolC
VSERHHPRSPEGLRHGSRLLAVIALVAQGFSPAVARAQPPTPTERITFQEAIRLAIERNPSSAVAAAGILRAEGLLVQARAATRPQLNGFITTTTLNTGVEFGGQTVSPQNSVVANLDARMPIFAAAQWARRAQAQDTRHVAELTESDTHRQVAFATADAYISVIGSRRQVEASVRARDVARAHYDLARELREGGTGSRLNELRAQQEFSSDDALVEAARLMLYRAQEALGILIVADGPVDAAEEPNFDLPTDAQTADAALMQFRTDLRLFSAEQQAADRVLRDSSKDYWPTVEAIFQPQTTYPKSLFLPQNRWQFLLQGQVPIFDSGDRRGLKLQRQAAFDISRANVGGGITRARAEVRTAREAVASADRAVASTRAAADQAQQVVNITNISFRAGGATNIEVIDAERRARDADLSVGIAEDVLRRARLELLTAVGRFP